MAQMTQQTTFLPVRTNDLHIAVEHALITLIEEGFKIDSIRCNRLLFYSPTRVADFIASSIFGECSTKVKKYLLWHCATFHDRSGCPCCINFCIDMLGSRGGYKGSSIISFDVRLS